MINQISLSLHKLQIAFQHALLTPEKTPLSAYIHQNGLTANQRIQIYQNNLFFTLTSALKKTYPTVYQLAGESFFSTIAKHYMIRYPSTFADLNFFGIHFGKFLAIFPVTKSLVYLKEMALLEWACHEVFREKEVEHFDLDKLKIIPENRYHQLKFKLNPACRLLACQYPILSIWKRCQKQPVNRMHIENNLAKKEEKILIIRRSLDITFEKLKEGEFSLLSAFGKGLTFNKACALALKSDRTFNIENYLKQAILKKVIVDFHF